MLAFAKTGTSAKLLPVYPSKTFPNHLSIITGVYPKNHGIIHNKFYHPQLDKKYYLGAGKHNSAWLTAKPFWSVVQEHNISSAVYFWPESEAIGQGSEATYHIPYKKTDTEQTHFDQIINWLKLPPTQAPQFIVSYFSSVDNAGHNFGLGSPELSQAITDIDNLFGHFMARLKKEIPQDVNVILLSDHGMVQINKNKNIDLTMVFNKNQLKLIDEKTIVIAKSSTQLFGYFDQDKFNVHQQKIILQELKARQKLHPKLYRVFDKNNYPKHWRLNNNLAITPSFVVEAAPSASFVNEKYAYQNIATHGYDAFNQSELTAIFLAAGPDIIQGRAVNSFENIHIVPLMSQLLGIKQPDNIDGENAVLAVIVKSN